ncbi:MAG: hypothetical protein J2P37_24975 [Ktedonobacteraceae bacterium]|nr:hypothetical protein [Ktedonobacteraceae bacterium]MBO0790005.1 hypothetical protein [Ktedonobacteraceae bacterium]
MGIVIKRMDPQGNIVFCTIVEDVRDAIYEIVQAIEAMPAQCRLEISKEPVAQPVTEQIHWQKKKPR